MMSAVMAITMASCSDYDMPYWDTPSYNDDVVGSWESVYGCDAYGEFDLYGFDVIRYDFYPNNTGRYTFYEGFERYYVDFDWEIRGSKLCIWYYDGLYESVYYGYDRYGYLMLSLDRYFYEYTAYCSCGGGRYYAPAKTQENDSTATTGDKVTKRESNVKVKALSRGILARDTE